MPDASTPAALRKAEALARHVQGTRTDDCAVLLSDREAWEFLDWYAQRLPRETVLLFEADLAEARAFHDPWPMLRGFQVQGFGVTRLPVDSH